VDTPPKVDADLRPALREADIVLVPVTASHLDLWATEGVLDLCARERKRALIVLNRAKSGTNLAEEIAKASEGLGEVARARLGQRVVFAEALGQGLGVSELGGSVAVREAQALLAEVRARLTSDTAA
jgi:chromosome partitioning protein